MEGKHTGRRWKKHHVARRGMFTDQKAQKKTKEWQRQRTAAVLVVGCPLSTQGRGAFQWRGQVGECRRARDNPRQHDEQAWERGAGTVRRGKPDAVMQQAQD